MQPAVQNVLNKLEELGYTVVEDHLPELEAHLDGVADAWEDHVIPAIANGLPHGGIKDVEFKPVKDAIIAAVPQIDEATNEQINKGVEWLLSVIKPKAAA